MLPSQLLGNNQDWDPLSLFPAFFFVMGIKLSRMIRPSAILGCSHAPNIFHIGGNLKEGKAINLVILLGFFRFSWSLEFPGKCYGSSCRKSRCFSLANYWFLPMSELDCSGGFNFQNFHHVFPFIIFLKSNFTWLACSSYWFPQIDGVLLKVKLVPPVILPFIY